MAVDGVGNEGGGRTADPGRGATDTGDGAADENLATILDASPLSRMHLRVWVLAAMGIMLDGFDFFIVGVALPLIKVDLAPTPLQTGLISAAAVLGAMVGAVTIGRLTDHVGRKLVFRIDLASFVIFALASALAPGVAALIAFRFLLGVGIGADYPISASYVAEVAPARTRTRLLVGTFAFQAVGQLLGVIVGLAVLAVHPDPGAWRWMFAFGVLPALVIMLLRRGVPESPRWLAQHGRIDEACAVAAQFCGRPVTPAQVRAYADVPTEQVHARDLFGPRLRRRTVLTTTPWFLMDIATYGVGVFTPTIIAAIGVSAANSGYLADDIASTKGAALVDLFLVVGFGLAFVLIGRVGHIRMQVGGFAAMACGLLVLAGASWLPGGGDNNLVLVFAGFSLFNLCMNAGPNTTTFILPAEVFPTSVRASAHGLAASCGKAGAAVGLIAFPLMQDRLGLSWTLVVIAAGCLVALALTLAFRVDPETEGLPAPA